MTQLFSGHCPQKLEPTTAATAVSPVTFEFFISLVELDEFDKIKLLRIGRLDQGLNLGHLHNSQAC